MPVSQNIEWIAIDELDLDARNPRLGRHFVLTNPSQEKILNEMRDWSLGELAVSFLESGFWTQEPPVIVEEDGKLVVVEGNRRIATLKLFALAKQGAPVPKRWEDLIKGVSKRKLNGLATVPCLRADSRKDVQAYLGFRHVSGIKQWEPTEKAQFIAHLIEDENLTYEQVMRRIGSTTPTVRQNYIAYRLLIQMENEAEEISIPHVEHRFSVLYLSLRTVGTRKFLHIDVMADPRAAKRPVPKARLKDLENFALWLFGNEKTKPLLPESRNIDDFGKILESKKAIDYLGRTDSPTFQAAFRIAGGDESEVVDHLDRASDEVREALRTAHLHKKSRRVREASERLGLDVMRLLDVFPDLKAEITAG